MLDVKKTLAKLIAMFTISQTQSFTACGKDWHFRRVGRIVFLDAPADIQTATAGMNTIGTLPEGMRPTYTQRIHTGNSTYGHFMQIEGGSGLVRFYATAKITSAQNNSFSTSFIAEVGWGTA